MANPYEASTSVDHNSRVVFASKLFKYMSLDRFIRLTIGSNPYKFSKINARLFLTTLIG